MVFLLILPGYKLERLERPKVWRKRAFGACRKSRQTASRYSAQRLHHLRREANRVDEHLVDEKMKLRPYVVETGREKLENYAAETEGDTVWVLI